MPQNTPYKHGEQVGPGTGPLGPTVNSAKVRTAKIPGNVTTPTGDDGYAQGKDGRKNAK